MLRLLVKRREWIGVFSVLDLMLRARTHPALWAGFWAGWLPGLGHDQPAWYRNILRVGLGAAFVLIASLPGHSAPELSVRVNRWLEVQQTSGTVTYLSKGNSRPAHWGDRLQSVGDRILTAAGSTATLAVDTEIGLVEVAENTSVLVKLLEITPDHGRVTRLQVDRGRVQLRVRPFNNPGSRLEIETPAGVSGVRGTEFGVNVSTAGRTGVATLKGAVATAAQGTEVRVPAGFQNVILPGEPPTQPVPFTNQPRLDYRVQRITRYYGQQILIEGQIDPASTLSINGKPQAVDRDGRFRLLLPAFPQRRLVATVVTPLGQEQSYALELT